MNIKRNLVILATLPVMIGMTLPVLAQTSTAGSMQKQTSGSVQLSKKSTCARGACSAEKGGRRLSFAGKRMEHFRHRRSLVGMLHGQYALTDAQAEKLIALKSQFRDQAKPKFEDLISAKRKLSDLITQPNTDKAQLVSLQNQINGDRDALSDLKLENNMQQLSLLTDQQKQEIRHEFLQRAARFGRG
jgi:Spy/CpxP family protein refolding chaperone